MPDEKTVLTDDPMELTDEQVEQVAGGIGTGEQGGTSTDDGATSDAKKGSASSKLLNACCTGEHLKTASLVCR